MGSQEQEAPLRAQRIRWNTEGGFGTGLAPKVLGDASIKWYPPQNSPVGLKNVLKAPLLPLQAALSIPMKQEVNKKSLCELGAIPAGEEQMKRLNYHSARNKHVDVGADSQTHIAVKRLGQRHAFQGDGRNARFF
jgi:hypothetical protein